RIAGGRLYGFQLDSHEKSLAKGKAEIGHLVDRLAVRPRAEVVPHALARARAMAPRPAVSLRELKRRWRETTEAGLREAVRRELEMQDVTFPQPEVQERVRTLYLE
ncbi:MAG: hypothetical protein ACO3JJ_12130, partial [Opitutaceae bacterium]